MASTGNIGTEALSILNPFPDPLPGPSLLHHLIAEPDTDSVAIEYHNQDGLVVDISYRSLHERADDLASRLRNISPAPRTIIPLLVPQCAALYISELAILKSGNAFCPLNLDVPEERLRFILKDTAASLVITTPEFERNFSGIPEVSLVVLDLTGTVLRARDASPRPQDGRSLLDAAESETCNPSDPAYIMYTSGSTGTPKAVCISHYAVTQSLLAHDRHIPAFDRFLQFANPTFDVSVFEIFFPLFRRCTLVSCERTYLLSDLPKVMTSLNVDAAELTPSVVASLIRSRTNVPKLRTLLTIGEMLNPQTVREFAGESEEDSILYGMYGPTEAAIHCTLQPRFRRSDVVNTIGIPLDTVSCFIIRSVEEGSVPDEVEILPRGDVGELAVGGTQLADGYLNREEQTRAVFIHHPTYGPLYRTGDKARLTANGLLECLGRISKGQVKLRGQRIELGEIEHAASNHEGVHAVAAAVVDNQLVLFCVADSAQVSASNIEASCRKWLPRFMVPNDIVILDDFPYLPSGKTDTKQLLADYAKSQQAPQTVNVSQQVVQNPNLFELVRSVINADLSPSTKLASAGLDSLTAIKMATAMAQHGFARVGAVELLSCESYLELEGMLQVAKGRKLTTDDTRLPEWKKSLRESVMQLNQNLRGAIEIFPCTPLQDAMLVETARDRTAYVNSVTLSLPPTLTMEHIRGALCNVAGRHPALRTGFVPSGHDICAFAQIQWPSLVDDQVSEVTEWQNEIDLATDEFLLRPLRVQFLAASSAVEVKLHLHHAIYDQWSLDILVDDLHRAINGIALDDVSGTAFGDVAWQLVTENHSDTSRQKAQDFWQAYMTGCRPMKLPNLTGKVLTRRTGVHHYTSRCRQPDVASVAAAFGVSEAALFQTIFGSILGLYSDQTELVFGSVFSGRTAAIDGIQDVFGPLLATLPMRLSTDRSREVRDAAWATHTATRSIMAQPQLLVNNIKKAAGIDQVETLFDSIFVWQGTSRDREIQDDVAFIDSRDFVEFNLVLEVDPKDDCYALKATFNEALLPSAQVQHLFDQLDHALRVVSEKQDIQFGELYSSAEQESIMSVSNAFPALEDCTGGLPRLLSRTLEQHGDAMALMFVDDIDGDKLANQSLTYRELHERANRLAHYLLSRGLKSRSLVLVLLEKSVDLYVSILAVINAGCGYLPILPGTPQARIRSAIRDFDVQFALSDARSTETLISIGVENNVCVTGLSLVEQPVTSPGIDSDPSSIAYAIWTSGTTGTPKGVPVTQENITSNLLVLGDMYPAEPADRLLQSCNQAFDVSVFEIFFTWSKGMCLCSAKNDVLFRDIENAIRLFGVTHLSMTPTVASLVDPRNVPNVKFLVTAGEAVTPQVFERWADRGLWQGYGPSETTNICSIRPRVGKDDAINNIGPPFSNTGAFILSQAGHFDLLPRGALGEICFNGQQVFPGYQKMPDLTATKMIDHPVFGRIYHSGDLGRLSADGDILIEGRIDTQRKIRGQRVELKEITACMARIDSVEDSAVLVAGANGSERLLAVWVPSHRRKDAYAVLELDEDLANMNRTIKEELVLRLPSYMIPSAFIPITTLPMTQQSKIDTRKLIADADGLSADYFGVTESVDTSEDRELDPNETAIRHAAATTLGVPEASIRPGMSLYAVGLDSVSAIKLTTRIRLSLGVQLDISAVLRQPTITALATLVSALQKPLSNGHVSPLTTFLPDGELSRIRKACEDNHVSLSKILPCTPLQEAMLSASLSSSSSAYVNRNVLRLHLPVDRMRGYWQAMLERHQILRTVFVSTPDREHPFVQVVLEGVDLAWSESASASHDAASLVEERAEVPSPVDSFRSPYKLTACHINGGDYLLVDMHHCLYDANALSILFEEIEQSAAGATLNDPVCSDAFLEHMLEQQTSAADTFFHDMLLGFEPRLVELEGADSSFASYNVKAVVSADEVEEFRRTYGVSLLAIAQAAWAQVLSTLHNVEDVCFGNVVSGRTVPVADVDRLVAPCFNTIPLRADLRASKSRLDLVRHLHQVNVDSLQYRLTPLRRIQQQHGVQRLFDTLLLLQQPDRLLDSTVWELIGEAGDMDFPCILELTPHRDALSLTLHYDTRLIDSATKASSLCAAFTEAFLSLLRYPLSDLPRTSLQHSLSGAFIPYGTEQPAETGLPIENASDGWTDTEKEIRDVFMSLAPAKDVNITRYTTIYRLGLDSISAIQAAKALRSKGYSVTAADILQHTTPAELAAYLKTTASSAATDAGAAVAFDFASFDKAHRALVLKQYELQNSEVAAIRPCTAVQAGMLSAWSRSGGEQYLNHFAYVLGSTAHQDVARALHHVVSKHELLRTTFIETEDGSSPFAMVTLAEGRTDLVRHESGTVWLTDLDQQNTRAIWAERRLPPWRCTIIDRPNGIQLHFSMHHAVYDAESLSHILHDLRSALVSRVTADAVPLEPALSRIVTAGSPSKACKAFFTESLAAATPTLIPSLHPVHTTHTGVLEASLESGLTISKIEELCRTRGLSVQVLFQAAVAKLLSIYTGEEQVTFGVVTAGRSMPETEQVCFPCINTLPVTCNTTASDMLESLASYNAKVQDYNFTPLASIQSWLGLQNETLFNTIFAFQKPLQAAESDAWNMVHERATVDYAISIEVEYLPNDVLRLRTTFDSAILPEAQAVLMLAELDALTASLLGQDLPAPAIENTLSVLPPKDAVIETDLVSLLDMFDRSAAKSPDNIAFEFVKDDDAGKRSSQTWTYRELDVLANQVANLLLQHGVKSGEIVALCFEKCPEASFAFLGILRAGCTILAIDSTAPIARKEFVLKDANVAAVLCSTAVAEEFAKVQAPPILDLQTELNDRIPAERPDMTSSVTGESISYILYTSGTTGTPKGCELTNDNAVQALLAFQRLFKDRWTSDSVCCQFASYHFDVAILEHFWTWSMGIKLICAPRDLILEDLAGFIDQYQVSHIDLTPSLGRLLDPALVPSLHSGVFITGGEAAKPEMFKAWGETGCLFNFYGPTECTIGVTTFPSVPVNGKASNIGWQFDNVGLAVFKPGTLQPVYRGGVGELCIFGRLVGKGYLNRPDLTADRFPFAESIGERVYRTGDLVRVLHDGSIDFLGRADSQVKLRGQRLEIDEIIAVMRASDVVKDAVCIVARHEAKQKDQLVAFISQSTHRRHAQAGPTYGEDAMRMIGQARAACEEKLSGYMVPTHFIPVDFIPLSVNNKQDDKALKQLFESMTTSQLQALSIRESDNRPLDTTEKTVVQELASVLGMSLADARPSSNLFSLGLNSISAVQMSRRLKTAGLTRTTVALVMQNATVKKLASALTVDTEASQTNVEYLRAKQEMAACQQKYLGAAARQLGCSPADIKLVAPCTPLQDGILSQSLSSDVGLYFNRFLFEIKGQDIADFKRAVDELVRLTDILRTSFMQTDDGHVQIVTVEPRVHWQRPVDVTEEQLRSTLHDLHQQWIDRNKGDLIEPFSVSVVSTPTRQVCQICIHHALYDGISMALMLQRLEDLLHGREPTIEQHGFFDALTMGPLADIDNGNVFWSEQLQYASFGRLQSLTSQTPERDPLVTRISRPDSAMTAVCRTLGVTVQSIVQAAWLVTLAKYHASPVGVVVSGRSLEVDANDVVGPLFNTIPFAWHLKKDDTWASIVKRSHDFNVASIPFQHTPLRQIAKTFKKGSDEPLFDTLFVFQQPQTDASSSQTLLQPIEDEAYVAGYPLSFEAEQDHDGAMNLTLGGQRQVADVEVLAIMLDEFVHHLDDLIKEPDNKPSIDEAYFQVPNGRITSQQAQDIIAVNGSFEWTKEAEILRTELAALAGVDSSSVDERSTLFALGLDSIDAVKLSSRLKKHNILVPVSALLKAQTIPAILASSKPTKLLANGDTSAMAKNEARQRKLEEHVRSTYPDPGAIERVLPATPLQEAIVSEMVRSDYQTYLNHDVMELAPHIDLEKLLKAWSHVVQQWPILRTAFIEIEDASLESTYAQVVLKHHSFVVQSQSEETVEQMEERTRSEVADHAQSPPFRLTVLKGPGKQALVLSLSHALYDGHSLELLHSDVCKAYNEQLSVARPPHDMIIDRALDSEGSQASSYWEANMTGVRSCLVKDDLVVNERRTFRSELHGNLQVEDIKHGCRALGISPQALCQTAWSLVLAERTRSLDVLHGLMLAGRDSAEAEGAMFPMMNITAFRSTLHGTARDMLKDTQSKVVDLMPYQQTPLRHIQAIARRCNPDLRGPLFNTLFTYQKSAPGSRDDGVALYRSVQSTSEVEFPVAIEAEMVGDKLIWRIAVKNTAFSEHEAHQLLRDADAYMTSLVKHPEQAVIRFQGSEIRLLGGHTFQLRDDRPVEPLPGISEQASGTTSPLEEKIQAVVAQVAKVAVDEVQRNTRLDNLGIDSISAIKVTALLRKQQIAIPVSKVVQAGSVAELADLVVVKEQVNNDKVDYAAASLDKLRISVRSLNLEAENVERILPASAGQIYMLSTWLNSQGELFYPTFTYSISGAPDSAAIISAWKRLVQHHAILRTTFVASKVDGLPFVQVVRRTADPGSSLASLAVETQYQQTVLKLTIHHALYDAVSLGLLMDDLAAMISGATRLTTQSDLSPMLSSVLSVPAQEQRELFWRSHLSQAPDRFVEASYGGSRIDVFRPHLMTVNEARLRKEGISVQSLFFAAYARAYALTHSIAGSVVIGIYLANRADHPRLAAPTVNLVPLRIQLDQDLLAMARQVQADIKTISQPVLASVSLHEIYKWTGITIDTFVNFIRLPDNEEKRKGKVVIENLDDEREFQERSIVHPGRDMAFVTPKELQGSSMGECYSPTLDAEATVRNGKLAMGVFGYESRVSLSLAERIIGRVETELEENF